jgi:hypothetical protein
MSRLHKVVANHLASQLAFHKAMAEDPDNAADHHAKAMEECSKSMSDCDKSMVADGLEKAAADRRERAGAVAVREPGLSRLAPNPPGIARVVQATMCGGTTRDAGVAAGADIGLCPNRNCELTIPAAIVASPLLKGSGVLASRSLAANAFTLVSSSRWN